MLKKTSQVEEQLRRRSRQLGTTGSGLAIGLASLALLTACEGTLGPQDADGGPGASQGDGDGDGVVGDGDGVMGDGDTMGTGGSIFVPEQTTYGPGEIDPNGNKVFPIPDFDLEGDPEYSRAIPLTNDQWANAVQGILNLSERPIQANNFLNPVIGFTLFLNNEHVLKVNNDMRQAYQMAAAEIAEDQLADAGALSRINAGSDADSFIRSFGRRAFRRPLTEEEVAGYTTLYNVGAGLSGDQSEFEKGANLVIEGMLQSPNFLYRTELEADGAPLTAYEKIAKLSFWLLGTSPSDALLDRAGSGEFDTPEGIGTVVDEMLADPRATETIVDLYAELFKFSRYSDVLKEDPAWTPELNAELDEASRLFFEYIFTGDMGLDDILTTTQGFVGPLLAPLYNMAPPAGMMLTDLGPSRPGYFSQVPYLMLMGDGSDSDAIHRGVFLTFEVMCASLPSPPPDIPPVPPPMPDQTHRELLESHTGIGTCGEGCHAGYINALGFAFENFDGLGRERTTDNGQPVDTTSAYPFGGDPVTPMIPFNGSPELMPLIAGSQEAHACLAKSVMSHALARDIVNSDQDLILQLMEVSRADGSLKQIVRELVKSPAFLSRPGAI